MNYNAREHYYSPLYDADAANRSALVEHCNYGVDFDIYSTENDEPASPRTGIKRKQKEKKKGSKRKQQQQQSQQ